MSPNKSSALARRAKRIVKSPSTESPDADGDVSMNGGQSAGAYNWISWVSCTTRRPCREAKERTLLVHTGGLFRVGGKFEEESLTAAGPSSRRTSDVDAEGENEIDDPDAEGEDADEDEDPDADAEGESDPEADAEGTDEEVDELDEDAEGEEEYLEDEDEEETEAYAPPTTTRSGRSTGTASRLPPPPPAASSSTRVATSKRVQQLQSAKPASSSRSKSAGKKAAPPATAAPGLKIKLNVAPAAKGQASGSSNGQGRPARIAAAAGGKRAKQAARDIEMGTSTSN